MKNTVLLALAIIACGVVVGIIWGTFRPERAEALAAARPGTIAAATAADHVGQSVTVEGIVAQVHIAERATFIDVGASYPDEDFVGVIFPDNYDNFPDATALEGKTVDISGTIQLYRGKPEIVLRSASQIRIE
jgi:DNA/RNA endonuclease YhcR with UshA esterase domain